MRPMELPSSGPAPSTTVSRAPPSVTVVGCDILVTFFFTGWGILAIIVGYVVICRCAASYGTIYLVGNVEEFIEFVIEP